MTVRVEIKPSDTGVMETLVPDKTVKKTEFPLTIPVPVPVGGSTLFVVYIDNSAYLQEVVTGG
jgi:hypothetical protein